MVNMIPDKMAETAARFTITALYILRIVHSPIIILVEAGSRRSLEIPEAVVGEAVLFTITGPLLSRLVSLIQTAPAPVATPTAVRAMSAVVAAAAEFLTRPRLMLATAHSKTTRAGSA